MIHVQSDLEPLIQDIKNEFKGMSIDTYDNEMYIKREHGIYTVVVMDNKDGTYELGTYKEVRTEELANIKIVKSIRAVRTYLFHYLGA